MIKSIIIEDEKLSRDVMRSVITQYCSDIVICKECVDAKSGIEAIKALRPDLVFLDIEMPDGTGLDVIRAFENDVFSVVIISAYEHYAIDAFHLSVVDYLLKPIDIDDFMNAIKKVRKVMRQNSSHRRIVLSTSDKVNVVNVDDIIHCASDNYYTVFYFVDGTSMMISKTLKEVEEMLEEYGFTRTHKSHLVNNNFITNFIKDDMILVLKDDTKVPVSRRKKDNIVRLIHNL